MQGSGHMAYMCTWPLPGQDSGLTQHRAQGIIKPANTCLLTWADVYAMTINKSQGQSVMFVGLNLQTDVFSHGQLYVALSRCTSGGRIKVLLPENSERKKVVNIVYNEILQGLNL